ncbi:hypothetical protein ACOQFL_10535 [Actinopolyspora sp. H202]|uniref:hypothetical protein n=1 Tax=Actinopolyspora sp. H202 TaxID=1500456 RepID=UPI003EE5AB7F
MTKLVTRGADNATEVRNAKTALADAKERFANSRSLPEEQQRLLRQEVQDAQRRYDEINTASTTPNRFMKDRDAAPETSYKNDGTVRTSWTGSIKTYQPGVQGEQASAANIAQAGLNAAGLTGEARFTSAVGHQGMDAVVSEGVEQGVKQGYDETTEHTYEQRQAAQERGFT